MQRRLAEEIVSALRLQRQERTLNGADRRRRDIAILRPDVGGVVRNMLQRRLQILEIEKEQPFLIGDVKHDIEHAFLHIVQIEHAADQQRTHFGDCCANGMALLAEQIPEDHRRRRWFEFEAHFLRAILEALEIGAGHRNAGEIALHVRRKDGNAGIRQLLRHDLQRYRFAGARRTGDHAVPVGAIEEQHLRLAGPADEDGILGHCGRHLWPPGEKANLRFR